MRVLITSTDHTSYGGTGRIIKEDKPHGIRVELDNGETVLVPEGQFKIIPDKELGGRDL